MDPCAASTVRGGWYRHDAKGTVSHWTTHAATNPWCILPRAHRTGMTLRVQKAAATVAMEVEEAMAAVAGALPATRLARVAVMRPSTPGL